MKRCITPLSCMLLILILSSYPLVSAARPTTPGAAVCITVLDGRDGTPVEISTFTYNITGPYYESDSGVLHNAYNLWLYEWLITKDSNDTAVMTITVSKDGYLDSDPLEFDSKFYWDNVPNDNECFINHTFYLDPLFECGNGECEEGESKMTCSADCGEPEPADDGGDNGDGGMVREPIRGVDTVTIFAIIISLLIIGAGAFFYLKGR